MLDAMQKRFLAARRAYIASQFPDLNDMQRQAVITTEGPLLLLAGAGSGKTTVLINRIANLIRFGSGSDTEWVPDGVQAEDVAFLENLSQWPDEEEKRRADRLCARNPVLPWNIIAITFTNKAANELKDRLSAILDEDARDVWAMTFHAACCRILRRDIALLGYSKRFTIYDSADSERVMKAILKDMGLDEKTFPAKMVLSVISREKDRMISPAEMLENAEKSGDLRALHIARAYDTYQNRLLENDALDFDDIIFRTVELLQQYPEVREYYQRKFRYVLVDEYQDTNHMQYLLTSLLAGGHGNICVVGDDDQSIYRFRGASIENILSFETQYPSARTIRLEQNYRSTQCILNAANAVIAHNLGRKGKRLWTANGQGEPVTIFEAQDESEEGNYVAGQIIRRSKGKNFKDFAVLYRTNAQSNALEFAFKRNGIPYRVIGGTRFFDRAEIKDMLSYLCVINNSNDDLRLNRIINNPPRGIGAKTLESAQRLALAQEVSLYSVISHPEDNGPIAKSAGKFLAFTHMIEELKALLATGMSLPDFYDTLMEKTGYAAMLQSKPTVENQTRLENIQELKSSIQTYVHNDPQPTLAGFLEEIALYTDIEQYNDSDDAAVMMTMHSAKGLEFPHVFLVGFEDGLFPGMRAIGDSEEMEEERRLCYVAITRAKESLTISCARQRMLYGRTSVSLPSRFLKELPEDAVVRKGGHRQAASRAAYEGAARDVRKKAELPIYTVRENTVTLEFHQGDMVTHTAFGRGLVLSVMKMGGDALLEIAFDSIGTKKLLAKSASRHMKKLS
ncbi:MAG TPA: UvrD-helicase domain-containing protein [Candidatus Faecousia intestinigallinarum]|nr:UvrD-helicase domain-containing protein [Candidatus Faecousia intestinigallinarum]